MASELQEAILQAIVESQRTWGGFPDPTNDVNSLRATVSALKQAVEQMGRNRGDPLDSAVLVRDLVPVLEIFERFLTQVENKIPQFGDLVEEHDDLKNVTPDQHHNQRHDFWGPDHAGIDTSRDPQDGDIIRYNAAKGAFELRPLPVSVSRQIGISWDIGGQVERTLDVRWNIILADSFDSSFDGSFH